MGMFQPKGRIRFAFGEPIETHFTLADNNEQRNAYIHDIAELIDAQIYKNFKLLMKRLASLDTEAESA